MAVSGGWGDIQRFGILRVPGVGIPLAISVAFDMYGRQGGYAAAGWVAESVGATIDACRVLLNGWCAQGLLRHVPIPPGSGLGGIRHAYAATPDGLPRLHAFCLDVLARQGQHPNDAHAWGRVEWELMLRLCTRHQAATAASHAHAVESSPQYVRHLLEAWAAVDVVDVVQSGGHEGGVLGYRASPSGRRWMSEQIALSATTAAGPRHGTGRGSLAHRIGTPGKRAV